MIVNRIVCDICGKDILPKNFPFKFSTDSIAFGPHTTGTLNESTTGTLNENPSLIIFTPSYIQLCVDCMHHVLHTIAKEQKWSEKV